MSGHDRSKTKVVIDVLIAVKVAKLTAGRVLHEDWVRIVSAIVTGYSQRYALQVFLVRLRRLGRAAHKSVEFFL